MEYEDREREILTDRDRDYLRGLKDDLAYGSASNVRSDIRDRVFDSIIDFNHLRTVHDELLMKLLARDVNYGSTYYYRLGDMVSFVLRLLEYTDVDSERFLTEAVDQVAGPRVKDVSVNIDKTVWPVYDLEAIIDKVENNVVPDDTEISQLVLHGDKSETIDHPNSGVSEKRPIIQVIEDMAEGRVLDRDGELVKRRTEDGSEKYFF